MLSGMVLWTHLRSVLFRGRVGPLDACWSVALTEPDLMRTRLRNTVSAADLDELKDIHRRLQNLMVGMNPSASCHAPLWAAMVTVRACGVELSHDPGWGLVGHRNYGSGKGEVSPSQNEKGSPA